MKKVVVTDPDVWPWLDTTDGRLDFVFVPPGDQVRLRCELADAWAYVGIFLDETTAGAVGPGFCVAQITAAGTEHIAVGSLPTGTIVANASGHGRSIAEHVLMVLLAVRRQLLGVDAGLRHGRWANRIAAPQDAPVFTTLEESTVGVVGFGHIGRSIAQLCRAVGMNVIAVNRTPHTADPDATRVDGMDALPTLLEESDIVVLACPLTEDTRGLIGGPELKLLGPEGILINVARGPIVDEEALYDALKDGTIAGAAIDVWYKPVSGDASSSPSTLPFNYLNNIVMTPHYSATASNTYKERARGVLQTLLEAADGRPVSRVVDLVGSAERHG
ncbi:phosphoglycerate dehydrogenase-like enzyme [Paenarthrobacter nicotinovorans]|uniref:2-hydroxyacid dehydrogenase n=1 Tax=Paenarthrobacter nicotinovorans TaxID=29320 RepID=UPI002784756D|nr:2-hydroxyacid dehydrogenase [Paenarthrobacter nicotinovorans]MDP9936804.1 phosphoglycerate dehydrogenase-like enzyme [Paenarthrobacter nicotinovorans]